MMKNDILWDNLFFYKGHAFQLSVKHPPCSYTDVNNDLLEEKVLKRSY